MPDRASKGSLLVIFLTVFIDLLGFGMVLPLLPIYGKQFAESSVIPVGPLVGLLMASFSAMQFLFAPMWGRLSDRIGRRPVIMIGLAGSVIFYTIFGRATAVGSLTWLFVSRVGAGLAGATISTAHAYIADTTTLATRAKGMAMVGAAFGLGFTFGPLFGFLALWGSDGKPGPGPGYAAAALSAFALVLAYFKLPESLDRTAARPERKMFNFHSLADALQTPSVGLLLITTFVCIFSLSNFESTLSFLLKDEAGVFRFSDRQLCLAFAFIGLILTVVQGGVVRRLATRYSETTLARSGTIVEVVGFVILAGAATGGSRATMFAALALVVTGFAFIGPSLNSLISRRSDPAKQGGVMGVAQSVSSLARIAGPMAGATLYFRDRTWPFWLAAALMAAGLVLIEIAARGGRDYEPPTHISDE